MPKARQGFDASGKPGHRAPALLAVTLLLTTTLLAGCLDTIFPQEERHEHREGTGLLRVWIATSPGALGNEFAHYNISFGPAFVYSDLHLTNYIGMQSRLPTLDFTRMERDKLTAPLAEAFLPEGDYFAIATSITRATIAVNRIVGTQDGEPVVRSEESPILHNQALSTYRSGILVIGGRTTDVFIEVDLQRSLQRGTGGALHHTTIPHRITVLIDGNRAGQTYYDGGMSRLDPNDPVYAEFQRQRQIPLTEPPVARFRIDDIESDQRIYTNLPGNPSKRLNHAVGLDQELHFDASGSYSRYERGGEAVRIIEYTWDFGDGTTMRGARVTKTYTEGGIYDIVVTVRDDVQLVASDHLTIFVPYTAEQAQRSDQDAASGTLYLPSPAQGTPSFQATAQHSFRFPGSLEGGQLYLGGYRVEAVARDPLGGSYGGAQDIALHMKSGHFQASTQGPGPWLLETAGVPAWRGPLSTWVTPELTVDLELRAGLLVSYDVVVEPLYYYNLSRGLDPHATHIHSMWPFGPSFANLGWDGRVARE